jgi:hypothetical protein
MQNKQHICESFSSLNNMYGSGENSSCLIGTHHVAFLYFSKDKSLEL